ncbi:Chaperone protein dnaJ 1, mitochondrial [Smittium mucronatum]|uniref:Chaperone protein dnaJ 1, mitochondrial n=1 Tax=Smittium mucronatum TaxID=133383 RepID=A0A1R0H8P5_9FUNG|nr:Chaperone protein dnaJ 1, mitochondrial [Smittium mucronatum]
MKSFERFLFRNAASLWSRNRLVSRLYQSSSRSLTPHGVLGLAPNSTRSEIKARYYELCKVYHPDKLYAKTGNKNSSSGGDGEKFKQIQWAYEQLIRNRPSIGKTDFSNYDFYNRAAFYEQQQRAYDSSYNTNNGNGHNRQGYADEYGFYYSKNAGPQEKSNARNRILAGVLFGFVSISGYGFLSFYSAMTIKVSESLEKSHLDALAMLKQSHMKGRGIVTQRLLDLESKNFEYNNAQLSRLDDHLENELSTLETSQFSPKPQSGNQTFYLSPTKDEQIMRFIATFDTEEGGERVCFPYGRFG